MKDWLDTALPMVLAIAASLAVLLNLILIGPMAWHFQQPAAVQGGIEVALLLSLLAFCASRDGRWRWLGIGLLLAFYLRRHHVDLPVLMGLLVAEGLLGAGAFGDRGCSTKGLWGGIRRFVLGLALWATTLLLLHAAGLATPTVSLGLLLLGCTTMILLRRESLLVAPALRAFASRPALERAGWALLAGWFAVLMARSNHVVGFDGLWYLLRGQYVLAPNGSFFEALGMVSAVNYFPKLWELLLLPWDAASDLSFAVAFNLGLMVIGLAAIATVLQQLGVRRSLQPVALLAVATLPAIASTALALKTDITAWTFCMIAIAAVARGFRDGGHGPVIWTLCAISLACCAKLTALPYMGVLVLAAGIIALLRWRKRRATGWSPPNAPEPLPLCFGDWLLLGLTLCIGLGILWRTWLTSGLPTIGPDPLVAVWNLFGMHLRPPAGSLQWLWPQDWSDAPWLLPEALFAPNGLEKVRITWTGNVWLLCGLLALFWQRSAARPPHASRALRACLWSVALTGLLLLLAWKYHSRGSDGNYFIVAVGAACLLGIAAAARTATSPARLRGLIALLLICSMWQAALGFVSASWSAVGTRTVDLDLSRSVFDSRETFHRRRSSAHLEPVYQVLKRLPADTRSIGAGASAALQLMPTRMESLEAVSYSRPEYVASPEALRDFLISDCIEYVLVRQSPESTLEKRTAAAMALMGAEPVLATPHWNLHRLAGCPR